MEYATTKFRQFAISHHLNEIDVIEKPVSKTDFHNFGFHNWFGAIHKLRNAGREGRELKRLWQIVTGGREVSSRR